MYEMYPKVWGAKARTTETDEKPRRRARKEHTVAPRVLRITNR